MFYLMIFSGVAYMFLIILIIFFDYDINLMWNDIKNVYHGKNNGDH